MNAKFCRNCIDKKQSWGNCYIGYYGGKTFKIPENNKCVWCGGELTESKILTDELEILDNISSDNNFLQAMIELKEKDPIEFQLKMSQFRTQIEQQEQLKQTKEEQSKPHCPHCHSTNIKPISGLNRGASIAMWGIFSKKINKSFECLNCKYTW